LNIDLISPGGSVSNLIFREKSLFIVGVFLATFAGFVTFNAIPKFKDVFQSFGGDLPLVTSLALQFYPALLALPLLVLAVWFAWPRKEKRGLVAFVVGTASLVVVPLLVAAAMYLPIMQLGS
jgi:type II secretory pathway component PulF